MRLLRYFPLDGLDDLVVGGKDDGDWNYEAEGVDVSHVGDVVHRVATGTVPFHSTTEISKEMKLNTFCKSFEVFVSWEDQGHFLNKLSVVDHVSTFLDLYEIVFRKMEGNRNTIYIFFWHTNELQRATAAGKLAALFWKKHFKGYLSIWFYQTELRKG